MKKICLLFLLTFLPLWANADPVEIDGIYYNLISKAKLAEVTSSPNEYSGSIIIPSTVIYGGVEYSVSSIREYAFAFSSNLTSVTIPNSVTSIGKYAFERCFGLTTVNISDIAAWCNISFGEIDSSNPLLYAHHLYLNGEEIKELVIPSSLTSIGDYTFIGCSGLTSVIIPNNVTTIGNFAFYGCSGLTSVSIPNSVTCIDDYAFSGCTGLTSITIPNSVVFIEYGAFSGCTGLGSVIIPNSVTSIGLYAFSGCSGLTSLTISNSVTSICSWTFNGCTSLTSVIIPNSVTSIDFHAFSECSSLTTITIGSGITSIADKSFIQCPELTDVYCMAENVPDTYSDAFEGSYIEYATLHVPKGSIEAYKAAAPWSSFKDIAEIVGVQLNKTEASIMKGKTMTLTAAVYPEDLEDKSVTWKSSNTAVATVTAEGKVTGVKTGIVTITCTSNATGKSATCKLTVGKVSLNKSKASIEKGKTVTLTATVNPTSLKDKSVIWKSSNTKVATVSSEGKIKGVKTGSAIITCTSVATGLSATCKVIVGKVSFNKSNIAIEKGKTLTLTPSIYPTTLSDKSVTWMSSNTKVATVTADGKVTGIKTGSATITCTSVATGLSATCKVIIGKVSLDKSKATIEKDNTLTLTATVYPTTLKDKSVTWKSSAESVATVTADGIVTGVTPGTATITCTSNVTGLSATCKVTITATSGTRSLSGDDDGTTGIDAVGEGETEPYDVYDLSGRMVLHQVTSLEGLSNGIYIVNGKKVLKK